MLCHDPTRRRERECLGDDGVPTEEARIAADLEAHRHVPARCVRDERRRATDFGIGRTECAGEGVGGAGYEAAVRHLVDDREHRGSVPVEIDHVVAVGEVGCAGVEGRNRYPIGVDELDGGAGGGGIERDRRRSCIDRAVRPGRSPALGDPVRAGGRVDRGGPTGRVGGERSERERSDRPGVFGDDLEREAGHVAPALDVGVVEHLADDELAGGGRRRWRWWWRRRWRRWRCVHLMDRCRLRCRVPRHLTLHAGAGVELDVVARCLSVEGEFPRRVGDLDGEPGDAVAIGDVGRGGVGGDVEARVGGEQRVHLPDRPARARRRVPPCEVGGRVARVVDVGNGVDRPVVVHPHRGQLEDRHEPDVVPCAVGGMHLESVRAGCARRRTVGRGPHHPEREPAGGVLHVRGVRQVLRDPVTVVQRAELTARAVDDRTVAGELASGRGTGRALVLEEHAHGEVHGDVPPARVLAAAEQRGVFPFAGVGVVRAGVVDPVRHDAVATERCHHGARSGHLAGIPGVGVGSGGHGALAVDVLHHAVAHARRVVGAGGDTPQRSVVCPDEGERATVVVGARTGPRRNRRRWRDRPAESVACRAGRTVTEPIGWRRQCLRRRGDRHQHGGAGPDRPQPPSRRVPMSSRSHAPTWARGPDARKLLRSA